MSRSVAFLPPDSWSAPLNKTQMSAPTDRQLTTLEYVVLGLIGQAPQSGYTIMAALDAEPYSRRGLSPGAIYPALKRLEELGLVSSALETSYEARPRKVYALTPAGEEHLGRWLRAPVSADQVLPDRDVLLMKFRFAGRWLSRQETRHWLGGYEEALNECERSVRALPSPAQDHDNPHRLLVREALFMDLDAQHAWVRLARRRLFDEPVR